MFEKISLAIALLFLLISAPIQGQSEEQPAIAHRGNFNFNPPGARSLGMGATFIAIADDATASEANPAGLVILKSPEVSLHLRSSSVDLEVTNPFTLPDPNDPDPPAPLTGSFDQDAVNHVSFLSYVRPLSDKIVLSGYYQQAANFESNSGFASFVEVDETPIITEFFLNEFDLIVENFGISGAIKISPLISFGASIRFSRLDLKLTNFRADLGEVTVEGVTFPAFLFSREILDDDDLAVSYNAGFLINPGGKFSLGLVYKQGAEFDLEASRVIGFALPDTTFRNFGFVAEFPTRFPRAEFSVPTSWGMGIAFRPSARWVIGLDGVLMNYSDIELTPSGVPEDKVEVHFGVEYAISPLKTPSFIRFGYYNNPDHDGDRFTDTGQDFFTIGGGVFLKERLQLDVALAFSDDVTDALLSFVWHFGSSE